jgi:hypothetical protein
MSPESPACGLVRSADDVNREIRALWSHPQVPLTAVQRETYARLLAELRRAERGDVSTAA